MILLAVRVLFKRARVRIIPIEIYEEEDAGTYTLPLGVFIYYHASWPLNFAVYMSDVLPTAMPEPVLTVARAFRTLDASRTEGARKALRESARVVENTAGSVPSGSSPVAGSAAGATSPRSELRDPLRPPRSFAPGESGPQAQRPKPGRESRAPGRAQDHPGQQEAGEDPWRSSGWQQSSGSDAWRSQSSWRESHSDWWKRDR